MKAVIQIVYTPQDEYDHSANEPGLELAAMWSDGVEVRGKLKPAQILVLLEQAKMAVYAGVEVRAPSKIVSAPKGLSTPKLKAGAH